MRNKLLIFTALFLIFESSLWAQTDFAWISTGKVRARITPTGIHRDAEGGFLLENDVPGQPPKNLLSHLTPWVGGIDPGNNLALACEMTDPTLSDWKAGFRNIPNSGKVWKVSAEQIAAHLADYQDNGVIDNPIPAIFSWPGRGNPHSLAFNGFSLDSLGYIKAPFEEFFDFNNQYNPENGDFPRGPTIGGSPFLAHEFVFAPFYHGPESALTNSKSTGIDGHLYAYTLHCNTEEIFDKTIFFEFGKFYNTGANRLDSLHWGIFADFDLGNPEDDYLGYLNQEDREMVYAYNADTLQDDLIGQNPPAIALMSLVGAGFEQFPITSFMPMFADGNPYTRVPVTAQEFYNYITGSWRAGDPLTTGGIGFNPSMLSLPPQKIAFPDYPLDPNGWSELAENNVLKDRKCLLAYGPTTINPQMVSPAYKFALTVSDKVGLSSQLQDLIEIRELQKYLYNGNWNWSNPLNDYCINVVSNSETSAEEYVRPNPAQDYVVLKTSSTTISRMVLYNAIGQQMLLGTPELLNDNEIQISLKNLPTGIYFLHWISKDGRRGCEKVVKN